MQMHMSTSTNTNTITNTNKHAVHNGDAHVHAHAQVVTKEEQVEAIYKYFFDKKTLTPGTRERTSFQFLPLVGVIIIMGSRMWVVITFQKVIGSISGTTCGLSQTRTIHVHLHKNIKKMYIRVG